MTVIPSIIRQDLFSLLSVVSSWTLAPSACTRFSRRWITELLSVVGWIELSGYISIRFVYANSWVPITSLRSMSSLDGRAITSILAKSDYVAFNVRISDPVWSLISFAAVVQVDNYFSHLGPSVFWASPELFNKFMECRQTNFVCWQDAFLYTLRDYFLFYLMCDKSPVVMVSIDDLCHGNTAKSRQARSLQLSFLNIE